MPAIFRLLLIEDDQQRIKTFQSWLPNGASLVVATGGGTAMGLLRRAEPGEFGGVLLDHDLQEQSRTVADTELSGSHLIGLIMRHLTRDVAILVHSGNLRQGPLMAERLDRAGFWVTRVPMYLLTHEYFHDWVENVRSEWEERWAT
jgi:CheY-like chemotaxis protein